VLSRGMALAGAGAVIGMLIALWAGRLLQSLLFGVSPRDPATAVGVLLLVTTTVLAAHLVPARRALGIDPSRVLRSD